jgi:hypothetical protein
MNRLHRFAAWMVIGLGALTTIATSRAPTSQITGGFDRTLAAHETAHVTYHVSAPAMDHVRALTGSLRFRVQTSGGGFRFVPDGDASTPLTIARGGATGAIAGPCPDSGGCDLGFTLEGPTEGEDAVIRTFLDVEVAAQNDFPAGSTVTAEED